eukprot:2622299-Lingulodinium_polyedra.AAC.1
MQAWRPLAPQALGCHIWFERQTRRTRCSYMVAGVKVTKSQAVDRWGEHESILWCLRWCWKQRNEATGQQPPC